MINAFKGKRQLSAFGIVSNTDKVGLGWTDKDKFGGGMGETEISEDGSWTIYGTNNDEFGGWDGNYTGQGLPKVWTAVFILPTNGTRIKNHVSSNYRYAMQNVEMNSDNITQYSLSGDTSKINTENKNQFSKAERHALDVSLEWKLDSNTSIRLTANGGNKVQDIYSTYHTETWYRTDTDGAKTINDRILPAKRSRNHLIPICCSGRSLQKKDVHCLWM